METKNTAQEVKVEVFEVVKELPTTEARKVVTQNGQVIDLITTEEALKEILTLVRDLKKGIVG
jgi:hypothetical protein